MNIKQFDQALARLPQTGGLIARSLHWLLGIELAAIGGIAAWRFVRLSHEGYAIASALGLAALSGVAVILFVRLLITAHSFQLSIRMASPCPQKLSPGQWLRLFFAEFYSTLYSSSWAMLHHPFSLGWQGNTAHLPVLLVHGYVCNSGYWHRFSRLLQREQIVHYAIDLEPVFGSIDDYVPLLRDAVNAVCRETGARQVILVAHSMGGLAARAYLRAHGSAQIAHLITVGTPHHGTGLASRGPGINSRQMEWDAASDQSSSWLQQLAQSETPEARSHITSIFSWHDNIVAPQLTSQLEGANNIPFFGIGHVELALNSAVQQCVLAEIKRVSQAALAQPV